LFVGRTVTNDLRKSRFRRPMPPKDDVRLNVFRDGQSNRKWTVKARGLSSGRTGMALSRRAERGTAATVNAEGQGGGGDSGGGWPEIEKAR